MEFKNLISSRLDKEKFYYNEYYKFEKYSNYKKQYLKNHDFVFDFGIGESETLPPFEILSTLAKDVYNYDMRVYSDNGIERFKLAAAKYLKEIYNVEILSYQKQINHVMGAKSALTLIPLTFIDKDDIVINTIPGYDVLANMAKWLEAKIYNVSLLKENNYLVDLDSIDESIYQKCKIFIINYPNNPTGAIATKDFYKKLIDKAKKYNFIIVNDNTYGPIVYKQKPLSIFNIEGSFDVAVEIHSLSKVFSMSGMRLGFIVGSGEIIDIIKKVKDNVDSGQYIPIQEAGIVALKNAKKQIKSINKKYYSRMLKIASIFTKHNFDVNLSEGTYYLYIKHNEIKDSELLAKLLLEKCGVFVIPFADSIRLSMTFNISSTANDFYNKLDNALDNLLVN